MYSYTHNFCNLSFEVTEVSAHYIRVIASNQPFNKTIGAIALLLRNKYNTTLSDCEISLHLNGIDIYLPVVE